ncbi:head-tail adaptor protein [Roseicyclus marinus]|uniref:head-tail adaptor protein n=1 Tax=Roseicyclus marinus TaxID=2161673 RepID=UPI00240FFDB3|nr:head-tail adaptor protein [Roseicyclus marinus]MDG3040441.1 head-tail adaptor protein [Roseicyclus marinus]
MTAGKLDRRVQFRRASLVDNGFEEVETWADHGAAMYAEKLDLSDGERWRAGEVAAQVTTRFRVRSSAFTRSLTPKDRMVCEGLTYDIAGIKESGTRRTMLEITAAARIDQ